MVLVIGIAHLFMPEFGYRTADLAAIPSAQKAHFVDLGTYAIASFLLGFGLLSLIIARMAPPALAIWFSGILAIIWIARLLLEMLYPVDLPLFFVLEPHGGLMAAIAAIAVCYVLATIGYFAEQRSEVVKEAP